MEIGKVAAVTVPLLLVMGTAVYLLYLRRPKRPSDTVFTFSEKTLRISFGSSPPECSVLIIENDESLTCSSPQAKTVALAAGDSLRRECEGWVEKYGNPLPGEKVVTGAGRLLVKKIFHVVPNEEQDALFLRDLFREQLREAACEPRVATSLLGLSSGYSLIEYLQVFTDECKAVLNDMTLKLEELTIWCADEAQFTAVTRAFN